MKNITDRFFVLYKKRNKNVWVTKGLDSYLTDLSKQGVAADMLQDYEAIAHSPTGSYQTPFNQLELIAFLAKLNGVQNVLELGTFKGFTAAYLALALGKRARVTTCEINQQNIEDAKKLWERHGVSKQVLALQGDGLKSSKALKEKFDLVYIDADKQQYPAYYQVAKRVCKKGGLILMDNMLWAGLVAKNKTGYSHAKILNDLNQKIYTENPGNVSMVPAWDGLLLIKR